MLTQIAATEIANPGSLLTDMDVVARVLGGETALFELLIRRHNQQVYRAVRAVLRSETEVEDTMQQAYLSAYKHLAQFAGEALFSTWLVRIAVNEACGRIRRRGPAEVPFDGDEMSHTASEQPSPEARASSAETLVRLQDGVEKLPESHRLVFMLREVEGMDTDQTALVLGVSTDVVKTRLHRAKESLREHLQGAEGRGLFLFHATRCDRVVASVLAKLG